MSINHHPCIHDPGVQLRPDQPNHSKVIDAFAQSVQQDIVVDPVKELDQIHTHIHHHAFARLDLRPRGLDRIVGAPAQSKPVCAMLGAQQKKPRKSVAWGKRGQRLLGSTGVWSRCGSRCRGIGLGGFDMHSVSAVLFTAHVQAVTAFADDIQRQGSKDHESNNEFPHHSSPKERRPSTEGRPTM
jgi:hypothetical protein